MSGGLLSVRVFGGGFGFLGFLLLESGNVLGDGEAGGFALAGEIAEPGARGALHGVDVLAKEAVPLQALDLRVEPRGMRRAKSR